MSYEYDENRNEELTNIESEDTLQSTGANESPAMIEIEEVSAEDTYNTEHDTVSEMNLAAGESTSEMPEPEQSPEPEIVQMQFSPEGAKQAEEKSKKKKEKKEKKPSTGFGRSALNGAVFGLCGALVFSGFVVVANKTFLKKAPAETATVEKSQEVADTGSRKTEKADEKKESATIPVTDTKGAATISEITKATMPSIVSITVKGVEEVRGMFGTQSYESEGAGSGIVVSEKDDELLIATNNHVVSNANEVSVCFQDSEDAVVAAKVCGTDVKNDLAIVSVKKSDIDKEVLDAIKVIKIGTSEDLSVGDQVIAIGNALGYGQSVTTGIVSALDREVEIENMAAKLIQTDAAINPGNSGGALLNMSGELIGINSAKFASSQVEGMGYAIPIDTAMPILDKLMNRASMEKASPEEAGFLGVTVKSVSEEVSQMYGIPEGAYIDELQEDGAAQKAGLKKGDVITKFDGIGISGLEDLKEQVAYYKQGDTVEVTYMRMNDGEYEEKTVKVTLAAYEDAKKARIEEEENSKKEKGDAQSEEDRQEDNYDNGEDMQRPPLPDRDRDQGQDDGDAYEDDYGYGQDGSYSQEDIEEFFRRFFGAGEGYDYGNGGQKGY